MMNDQLSVDDKQWNPTRTWNAHTQTHTHTHRYILYTAFLFINIKIKMDNETSIMTWNSRYTRSK